MPSICARYRDTAANSSGEVSLVIGMMIRTRGFSSVLLWVVYRAAVYGMFSSNPSRKATSMRSPSSEIMERDSTVSTFLRPPISTPATKPP